MAWGNDPKIAELPGLINPRHCPGAPREIAASMRQLRGGLPGRIQNGRQARVHPGHHPLLPALRMALRTPLLPAPGHLRPPHPAVATYRTAGGITVTTSRSVPR